MKRVLTRSVQEHVVLVGQRAARRLRVAGVKGGWPNYKHATATGWEATAFPTAASGTYTTATKCHGSPTRAHVRQTTVEIQ